MRALRQPPLSLLLLLSVLAAACGDEPRQPPPPIIQPPAPIIDQPVDLPDEQPDAVIDAPLDGDMMAEEMGCVPETDEALCTREGIECGPLDVMDSCGAARRVASCGDPVTVCMEADTCGGGGEPGVCGCTPTTCESAGVLCGELPDSCGGMLSCDAFCVDAIDTGELHGCAIGSGKLKCWGNNDKGQLGNAKTGQEPNPVDVLNLPASAQALEVAAGGRHTCARLSDTSVRCWGDNNRGQLGVGTTVNSTSPGATAIASGALQVVTGTDHSCAMIRRLNAPAQEGNAVKCWGSNQYGQIGDPELLVKGVNAPAPQDVFGLDQGVTELIAGYHHTCALMIDGTMRCWGRNNFGQLGNLAPNSWITDNIGRQLLQVFGVDRTVLTSDGIDYVLLRQAPVAPPLSDVITMSAGRAHTCALTRSAQLFCWGALSAPSAGSGCPLTLSGVNRLTDTAAMCLYNQEDVNAMLINTASSECAIWPALGADVQSAHPIMSLTLSNGRFGKCGAQPCAPEPINVSCPTGACVLVGSNSQCEAPIAKPDRISVRRAALRPSLIASLDYVEAVASGRDHICALIGGRDTDNDGILDRDELGNVLDPTDTTQNGLPNFRDSDSDGDGIPDRDEAGDADPYTPPVDTDGDGTPDYLDLDSDNDGVPDAMDNCRLVANPGQEPAACADDADGDGVPDASDNCPFVANPDQQDTSSDGVGDACQADETNMVCFGMNGQSQLGEGTDSPKSTPTAVFPDGNNQRVRAQAISLGDAHSCAMTNDNSVKCWGSNARGQIGNSALMRQTSARPFDVRLR